MTSILINTNGVQLVLTQARGKVRIADNNGNHIRKPTEGKKLNTNLIEWMITNEEIKHLSRSFLNKEDIKKLIEKLSGIAQFIKDSKYATRDALKLTTEKLDKFGEFSIYKYTENFYSFEKQINSKIIARITFKMGDYTLAPFMFVLIPFNHPSLIITNAHGEVRDGQILGKKCRGLWKPTKEDITEIVTALSHSSKDHREDLVNILKDEL